MTRFWILLGSSLVHGDALNLSTSLQEQLYQKVVKSHKAHVNPKLKFHHGSVGWGVYAIEPVEVGETLIRLERDNQITIEDVSASLQQNVNMERLKELGLQPDCLDALTWTVLLEQRRGLASPFSDYFAALPGNYDSVLERWPNEYERFLLPSIKAVRREDKKLLLKRYALMRAALGHQADDIDLETFHIAHLNVVSRFKDDVYPAGLETPDWITDDYEVCGSLAPVFDMVNHSDNTNCDWDYDETGVWIHAVKPIAIYEELFINYGSEFNHDLARVYGFTLADKAAYLTFNERDVHMFHCTQELEMPLTKCGVVMMATDPDDIWLNEQCEFGDEESGEILAELIEHYHGNEEGLSNTEDEWKQHFFIWLLERRQKEINKVKENLDSYDFPEEQEYYKSMIVDMITPPNRAIQTCMGKFIDYNENNKL